MPDPVTPTPAAAEAAALQLAAAAGALDLAAAAAPLDGDFPLDMGSIVHKSAMRSTLRPEGFRD